MSKVKDNIVTTGLSGMLAKQIVFRNRVGETIVAKAPGKRNESVLTDRQTEARTRFKKGIIYAKKVNGDPELKQAYHAKRKGLQSAFNVAFKDFMTPPVIHEIEKDAYTGQIGDTIFIYATDDFQVKQLKVHILDASSLEIESGTAVRDEERKDWWKYTATVVNIDPLNSTIRVYASDLPGNEVNKDFRI